MVTYPMLNDIHLIDFVSNCKRKLLTITIIDDKLEDRYIACNIFVIKSTVSTVSLKLH